MKLWARVFLGYFLIVGLSGWFLLRVFVSEVKPGVRDAVEDVMVDTAQLLAELARDDLLANRLPNGRFAQSVRPRGSPELRLSSGQARLRARSAWAGTRRRYRVPSREPCAQTRQFVRGM